MSITDLACYVVWLYCTYHRWYTRYHDLLFYWSYWQIDKICETMYMV